MFHVNLTLLHLKTRSLSSVNLTRLRQLQSSDLQHPQNSSFNLGTKTKDRKHLCRSAHCPRVPPRYKALRTKTSRGRLNNCSLISGMGLTRANEVQLVRTL